jgi:NTE family protein
MATRPPAIDALHALPAGSPFLDAIGMDVLSGIEGSLEWFGVPAGTTLFRKGDKATEVYILCSGSLGVFVDASLGRNADALIVPGETVGEMSVISGERRSASVVALRDSVLVRMPMDAIEVALKSSPELCFYVMRLLTARLQQTTALRQPKQVTNAIALVPLMEIPTYGTVGKRLIDAIQRLKGRVVMIDVTQRDTESERLAAAAQSSDSIVVYMADPANVSWTRHCIRQADRVIFAATAAGKGFAAAQRDAIDYAQKLHRAGDLVLVHPPETAQPSGGEAWSAHFPHERIFHLRSGNDHDFRRVVRMVLRRGVAVVCSGGGARGFAHIGVLKAFEEAGVPVDALGGTSMGALVAGMAALDLPWDEIRRRLHDAFVVNNPVSDYTLPIVALARGRRMSRLLRKHYGETRIEDTWKTFFCVSSNLSTGRARIHQNGPLWQALRATAAIPGVVPPLVEGNEVLVDGGVMNNFPTTVMKQFNRGLLIGIEVSSGGGLTAKAGDLDERSLWWMLAQGRRTVPGLLSILMRSGTVNGETQTIISRDAADLLIQPDLEGIDMLEFEAFDKAIESGYRAAQAAISGLPELRDAA